MNNKKFPPYSKEAPIHRPKRAFGTSRSTNIPIKAAPEKPVMKPSMRISRQQQQQQLRPSGEISSKPRISAKTQLTSETKPPVVAVEKNLSNKIKEEEEDESQKTVRFQEAVQITGEIGQEENTPEPPSSSSLIKPRTPITPYHSAENCSKCRLNRLESSSYWLAQIKLAESANKHSVAATFFRLALECIAEPVRSLRVELRRYLGRHGSLAKESQWVEVSRNYGLFKDETH